MNASTPAAVAANDSPADSPAGRHGDVDINGDLVDQANAELRPDAGLEADSSARLRASICATTPTLATAQLDGVLRLLARGTVRGRRQS